MTATLLIGDCIQSMKSMPDKSVHCCITSPPYFGLRDYGHDGQIGLEPTPREFVAKMVEVFSEVWRVLRDDGTLWLNLGDSYAANRTYQVPPTKWKGLDFGKSNASKVPEGLKPKDLIGIPWRVAFALQEAGWYLRQDIIWSKPNAMPESVKDRCTRSHEYIFMFSKNERYYYDHAAIMEDAVTSDKKQWTDKGVDKQRGHSRRHAGFNGRYAQSIMENGAPTKRNKRSVWSVTTKPYKGAHFAVFPADLIQPCILAGCPVGGTVLDPFGGSGTTAEVSLKHGRNAILCELNAEYGKLIEERIAAAMPKPVPQPVVEQFELPLL